MTQTEQQENIAPELVQDDSEVQEKSTLFNVEILSLIKGAQAQHGLRHGNYQRYREYCSRRLQRLRKVLKFKMGDKRRVTPKKVTEYSFTDARFIMLLVMTSERAWSMAMELKQDESANLRKRHHRLERLRKAVKVAKEMSELCENSNRVNTRTILESQAYFSYINGVLGFDLHKWEDAKENFHKAQTIYSKLSETLPKEEQRVYESMVEEITPSIRYCNYKIGDESAMDDLVHLRGSNLQDPLLADKLESLVAQSRERQASTMSELVWRGRNIRVKNNKVRLFLIGNKEFEDNILAQGDRDAKIDIYDSALNECKDAIQVTKDDVKVDPHSKNNNQVSDLQYLHSYLNYIRLTKTIERNLLIIEDLKERAPALRLDETGDAPAAPAVTSSNQRKAVRSVDFIRLYDIMLQNLADMASLPGVEKDSELLNEVAIQQLAFKAFRCFYAAQSKVNDKLWPEAMALFERVLTHAREAITKFQTNPPASESPVDIGALEQLVETIAFNQYRVHAAAVLATTNMDDEATPAANAIAAKKPVMERLSGYNEAASGPSALTSSFPPQFVPVPNKPIFFDLAVNNIEFPSLESKLQHKQQPSSWVGAAKSWFSWGAK